MDDGSCLSFFEVPRKPFEFKRQDTLDLHIALGVDPDVFESMLEKARTDGIEVRGPVDHGFCRSIYMRDPNGYVIELTASIGVQQEIMDPSVSKPREALARWQGGETRRARRGSIILNVTTLPILGEGYSRRRLDYDGTPLDSSWRGLLFFMSICGFCVFDLGRIDTRDHASGFGRIQRCGGRFVVACRDYPGVRAGRAFGQLRHRARGSLKANL